MLAPRDITNKDFAKSTFGGYKIDDVNAFLSTLAEEYSIIISEKNELEDRLSKIEKELESYKKEESSLSTVLIGAQQLADNIIREAKGKAGMILKDAQIKSDKAIRETDEQIDKKNMEFAHLQKKVNEFKSDMLDLYKAHIQLVADMPDLDPNEDYVSIKDRQKKKLADRNEKNSETNNTNVKKEETGKVGNFQAKQPQDAKEDDGVTNKNDTQKTSDGDSSKNSYKAPATNAESEPHVRGFVPDLEPRAERKQPVEEKYETPIYVSNTQTEENEVLNEQEYEDEGVASHFNETGVMLVDPSEYGSSLEDAAMYGPEKMEYYIDDGSEFATARRSQSESRFGELRFGDNYDLQREDEKRPQANNNKKRKKRR